MSVKIKPNRRRNIIFLSAETVEMKGKNEELTVAVIIVAQGGRIDGQLCQGGNNIDNKRHTKPVSVVSSANLITADLLLLTFDPRF